MQYDEKVYAQMTKQASPNSPAGKDCLGAFLVGGGICTVGQALCNWYMALGLTQSVARTVVSVTLIFLSAVFTTLGLYDRLAKFARAGTLVPITGFANSMVSPALEFKSEGFVMGVGGKLFSISGPVLVFGISSSVLYGVLYWIVTRLW